MFGGLKQTNTKSSWLIYHKLKAKTWDQTNKTQFHLIQLSVSSLSVFVSMLKSCIRFCRMYHRARTYRCWYSSATEIKEHSLRTPWTTTPRKSGKVYTQCWQWIFHTVFGCASKVVRLKRKMQKTLMLVGNRLVWTGHMLCLDFYTPMESQWTPFGVAIFSSKVLPLRP